MKWVWMILAGSGGLIAAVFVFRADYDKAFVAAAAGAVCWFLNYRWEVRARLAGRAEVNEEDEDSDEEMHS